MAESFPTILVLDQFGDIGGGQRIMLDLAEETVRRGWKMHVLCPRGPYQDALRALGAAVTELALPSMRDGRKSPLDFFRAYFLSRRLARQHLALAQASDLIVVNGLRTMGIARFWVKRLRKPAALYLHGIFHGVSAWLIRSFLKLPGTAAIAVSPLTAAPFSGLEHVHLLPNWVSPAFLFSDVQRNMLRETLSIRDTLPIVLVPGRYSPHKGQLLMLQAFRDLADHPCHIVFSGSALFESRGAQTERALKEAVLGNPQRVHMTRWEGALPSLFDGADLVVVPSVWEEPFGLTAIEAMARGKPLIVTNRGMLPVLAQHGVMAKVVSVSSVALADAMRDFLANSASWRRRAEAARDHVRTAYDPMRNRADVLSLWSSLITA